MNALHTGRPARIHTVPAGARRHDGRPDGRRSPSFDWAGQVKLAVVLSIVAAIAAVGLAGRIAEPVLIVGIIVVASIAGWSRIEPAAPARRPARQL